MSAGATAYVFWRGADGALWQAIGDARGPLSGPYRLGMGPLGSAPSAAIDAGGATYIFWKGEDGNLWEGYWNGAQWVGPFNRGMGPLGSEPSVAMTPAGTASVFWRGTDGALWQAIGDARGPLSGPYRLGMGPLGSAPAAAIDQTGATYVFWMGTNAELWEGYWNGAQWVGPFNRGMGPLGSEPSVAMTPAGMASVFWRGTDGALWQAIGDARGPLSGPHRIGMGPLGSAPAAAIDQTGATYVYWQGQDGNLWQGHWSWGGNKWVGPVRVLRDAPPITNLRTTETSETTVGLAWDYHGSGHTGFSVTTPTRVVPLAADARTATVSSLSSSTDYCFTVTPVFADGLLQTVPATLSAKLCTSTTGTGGDPADPRIDPRAKPPPARKPSDRVSITVNRVGDGTVTSSVPALRCGVRCSTEVVPGAKLTLLARPARGFAFAGWDGACRGRRPSCTLRAVSAVALTASFVDRRVRRGARMHLERAAFAMRWRRSVGRGTLNVLGRVAERARLRVDVVRATGARVATRSVVVRAGAFRVAVPLARGVLPGRYTVLVTGRDDEGDPLVEQLRTILMRAPPEGVVQRAVATASENGRVADPLPRAASEAWAHFVFAAAAQTDRALTVRWYRPNGKLLGVVSKPNTRRVVSFIRQPSGRIASGTWRAALYAGATMVRHLSIRVP